MKIINKISSYVDSSNVEFHYTNNKLYVLNYIHISEFNSKNITVRFKDVNLNIIGSNLVISKLLQSEMLITGNILSVEIRCLNE